MEEPEEHVNFFAKEEEAMRKQVENGLGFTTTDQKKTNQCRHESRVYLNDRPTQKKKNQTFEISEMSQQKLKREMDPMRIFLTDNDTKKRNPKDSNEKVALANTKDHEKDRLQKADNFETESEESESPCPYKKRRRRHHRHRHREHEYHHSSRSKRTSKKKRQKYDPKKRKKEKRNEVDSSNDCESSSSKDTYAHSKDSKHKTSFQKRKYNSHNSTSSSRMEATCSKFTMDELRKRRIERETMEGSRESKILSESFLSHKQKELGNDRIRMYQNQYHPTLSRKKVNY